MMADLRRFLRSSPLWIRFQETNREGWGSAFRRYQIQKKILRTLPFRTASGGSSTEVHILTWRKDCLNAIWAAKSFYHFSGVDYPLYFHDGGLTDEQVLLLKSHFPDSTLIRRHDANLAVEKLLSEKGFFRSLAYRRENIAARKIFDFFLLSKAETIISIDSDIVFFKKPDEILDQSTISKNLYNRDLQYAYSMDLDELEKAFGIRPPPLINSGLFRVQKESIRFSEIETWLKNERFFSDKWVTEQTIHALCSTKYGVALLSDRYRVSTQAGLSPELVCKHYPGYFRPLLYFEGMRHLVEGTDFLSSMREEFRAGRSG